MTSLQWCHTDYVITITSYRYVILLFLVHGRNPMDGRPNFFFSFAKIICSYDVNSWYLFNGDFNTSKNSTLIGWSGISQSKLDIWPIRIEYLYHCKNRSISQTAMKWPNFLLLIYLYTQMNHLIWVIKMWFIQIWVIYESHLKWPKMTFNDMNKYFVQIKHTKIILLLFLLNTDSLSLWWPSMCPVNPTRCPRFYDLAPGQFSNQTIMIFKQSLGVLSQ